MSTHDHRLNPEYDITSLTFKVLGIGFGGLFVLNFAFLVLPDTMKGFVTGCIIVVGLLAVVYIVTRFVVAEHIRTRKKRR